MFYFSTFSVDSTSYTHNFDTIFIDIWYFLSILFVVWMSKFSLINSIISYNLKKADTFVFEKIKYLFFANLGKARKFYYNEKRLLYKRWMISTEDKWTMYPCIITLINKKMNKTIQRMNVHISDWLMIPNINGNGTLFDLIINTCHGNWAW